jgi:hypothetical protein
MGRGVVEPDDDFRASNPPVNGPLLDALAKDFIDHGFNLRSLVRTITSSHTYQLSAQPNDTNRDDEINFSRAMIRSLQAEQLLDALSQVTAVPVQFTGYPLGIRAGQLPGVRVSLERRQRPTRGEQFLQRFGKPERLLSCACERSEDTTLGQAFQLLTGEVINELLAEETNQIGKMIAAKKPTTEIVEEFYLSALARCPSPQERQSALAYIACSANVRQALEDIVWGIVNAKEFLLRQ